MQLIIRQNKPQNHAQGFILSVLIYILYISENGLRRVQGNARNWNRESGTQTEAWIQPQSSRIFSSLSWSRGKIRSGSHSKPITKFHLVNLIKSAKKGNFKNSLFSLSRHFSSSFEPAPTSFPSSIFFHRHRRTTNKHHPSFKFSTSSTSNFKPKWYLSPREPLQHQGTSNFR